MQLKRPCYKVQLFSLFRLVDMIYNIPLHSDTLVEPFPTVLEPTSQGLQ